MSDLYLEVNLHNLYYNISRLKQIIDKNTLIMAVVKSNAYGHGSVEISKALKDDVDYLGVGFLEEGVLLRQNKVELPILLMGPTINFEVAYINDITLSITSVEQLEQLVSWTNINEKIIKFHLKVDTGMNRFGIKEDDLEIVSRIYDNSKYAKLEGVYSHFATTYKNNKSYVIKQKNLFDKYVEYFRNRYNDLIYHLANSENAIDFKDAHYDMVRIGNALYGPSNSKTRIGLKDIGKLKARVIYSRKVKTGEYIGYGNSYRAKKDMIVGTIPFGFYEGMGLMKKPIGSKFLSYLIYYLKEIYRYLFRTKTIVYYKGQPLDVLGKPNMQYTIIDMSHINQKNKDDILVQVRVSPIFIKESVERKYVTEV